MHYISLPRNVHFLQWEYKRLDRNSFSPASKIGEMLQFNSSYYHLAQDG